MCLQLYSGHFIIYSPIAPDWQTIRKLLISPTKECKLTYTKSDLIRYWYRLKRFRGV